jgi:hypothetical protein
VKAADPPAPLHARCRYRFLAIRPDWRSSAIAI